MAYKGQIWRTRHHRTRRFLGAITSAEVEVKISDEEESEEMVNKEKKIGLYSSEDTVGGRGVTAPSQPAQPELSALPPNIVATSLDVLAYIRQMICAYWSPNNFQENSLFSCHRKLVRGFLWSASSELSCNGEAHITHKTAHPCSEWDTVGLAEEVGSRWADGNEFTASDWLHGICGQERRQAPLDAMRAFPIVRCSAFARLRQGHRILTGLGQMMQSQNWPSLNEVHLVSFD